MCNEEIIKHMEEDMTFRGLSERTQKSYIWCVSRYMDFHKGKDILKLVKMKGCGLKYKAMFMTVYGGGLRISELCNLRIQDIDSKNIRILIRQGKESKYRYTLLSQTNLEILREYFRAYRPKHKENYLFISQQTTMEYAMVNQNNVKNSHRKYVN